MPKAPVQTSTQSERPKTLDVLIGVAEIAIEYRFQDKAPTISEMARTISTASRLLRFKDLDERFETENQAVLALARKRQLMSWTNCAVTGTVKLRELRGNAGLFSFCGANKPDFGFLFIWCHHRAMGNDDKTILDVVVDVTRDLRHTESFRELLHPLDDETVRKVANLYIDFLYRTLDIDRPHGGANNNRAR
jgi:hypothetical protein